MGHNSGFSEMLARQRDANSLRSLPSLLPTTIIFVVIASELCIYFAHKYHTKYAIQPTNSAEKIIANVISYSFTS